jgi:trans-aconitate methyltransferase
VIALDASPAMLELARQTLARFGERVSFVCQSARARPVTRASAWFSARRRFTGVRDHDALFRSIAAALVPGGRLRPVRRNRQPRRATLGSRRSAAKSRIGHTWRD